MIRIAHCKRVKGEYVGRPSPLGNPFVVGVHGDRAQVIEMYEIWLTQQIMEKNPEVIQALDRLFDKMMNGDLILTCWCSPLDCHADVIRQILEERFEMSKAEEKRKQRESDEKLYTLRRGGMTVAEIANRHRGTSVHSITQAIERHVKRLARKRKK